MILMPWLSSLNHRGTMDMADEDNADLIDKVREKQRLVK